MARARSIGNVYAELSVKDKMTVGVSKAQKKLASLGKGMMKVGAIAGGALAAGLAGAGVAMKSAIDAGGELNDMMTRTGANGEQLFILGQAFKNAGLEAEGVGDAVNKMQRNLVENAEAFEKLGMSVAELKGMDPAAAFRAISENISRIEDPAERTAAAMEVFGRSGAKMLAVINDPGAFAQAEDQVGSLGKTLAENASTFDAFGDAMGALSLKGTEFGAALAGAVLPPLATLVEMLSSIDMSGLSGKFNSASKYLTEKAAGLIPGFMQGMGAPETKLRSNADFENARRWAAGFTDVMSPAKSSGIPASIARIPGAADVSYTRPSAPFVGGAKDREILDQLKRQTAVLEQAKATGGLTW